VSIDNPNVIDAISTGKSGGEVILSLFDHLDWEDEYEHLLLLQNKINAYISFIESGQIFDEYPNAISKDLVIEVVSKYECSHKAREFLTSARSVSLTLAVELRQRVASEGDPN
jgi:hypothetical protein